MKYKADKDSFINEIEERKISYLVHFTKVENLVGIFGRKKLIPRVEIDKIGHPTSKGYFGVRDNLRYDDKKEYICLSIQHPNYYMFDRKQKEEGGDWCVILIDKKYIYCEHTIFSISNAASNFAQQVGIDGSFNNFMSLFKDSINKSTGYGSRRLTRENLLPCYPTCMQAEVLVRDSILCSDFIKVYFNDEQAIKHAEEMIKDELAEIRKWDISPILALFELNKRFWSEQRE